MNSNIRQSFFFCFAVLASLSHPASSFANTCCENDLNSEWKIGVCEAVPGGGFRCNTEADEGTRIGPACAIDRPAPCEAEGTPCEVAGSYTCRISNFIYYGCVKGKCEEVHPAAVIDPFTAHGDEAEVESSVQQSK